MKHPASDRTQAVSWLLARIVATGVLCWAIGFVWFLDLTTRITEPPPQVDGIVALTGGAGRVEAALHLLATDQADKLLVTGIGGNTDLSTLGRLAGLDLSPLAARITLGRYAASTRGNAVETAAWATRNHLRSLIVVTATYHMPRALTELRRTLPGIALFPLAVQPPAGDGDRAAAEHRPSLRLQLEEYCKYLLAAAGLSPWFPRREAAAPPPLAAPPEQPERLSAGGVGG